MLCAVFSKIKTRLLMPLAHLHRKPASDWTANVSHSGRGLYTVRQESKPKMLRMGKQKRT